MNTTFSATVIMLSSDSLTIDSDSLIFQIQLETPHIFEHALFELFSMGRLEKTRPDVS